MAQHISRKELKRDEVAETLAHGAEAVLSHQKWLWIGVGAALAVVLLVFGWRFYTDRQATKATAALDGAMDVFHARIRAVNEPQQPGEVTYVDEKNKYEDAAKKFAEVAATYPRTLPGATARYYAGVCYERLARYDEAQKWLRDAAGRGPDEVATLARFQLAGVLARSGKGDEAVRLYQQLIQKPSTFVPKPVAMLALADYYRKSNPQEATKLYAQVKTEFPNTSAADEAEKQLEALGQKSSG